MKRGKLTVRLATDQSKPSNPKEAFGDAKMPLGLLPDTAEVQFNLAFLEGALKYGQFNWRVAGVKASTYNRAIRRHLKKWWNGADADPVTMVHDLASIGACCAIILDAMAVGKFEDDRPPRADMQKALDDAAKVAAHLKVLFKDFTPVQYTQRWVDEQVILAALPTSHVPAGTRRVKPRKAAKKKRTAADRRKATLNNLLKHDNAG